MNKLIIPIIVIAIIAAGIGAYFIFQTTSYSETTLNKVRDEVNKEYKYPKGSYAMWEPNEPIPLEITNNPGVVGILAGANWKDIEKEDDVYNWSELDAKISQAKEAGFKVALKLIDSPAFAPDWIKNNPQVEKISVVDRNRYHKTYGQKITLPVFWDPIFHKERREFILVAGKRYANNPTVVAVMASFANFYSCEWFIPTEILKSSDYSTEKMFETGKEIIDTTANAFPNQALKLPLAPRDIDLVQKIVDFAYSKYPDRFFAQMNGLSTAIPLADSSEVNNATEDTPLYILKLLKQHSPQIGLQMLSAASLCEKGKECRQDKGNRCPSNDPKCVLMESVNIGLSYKPHFIEYWRQDAMNSELQSILQYANDGME